MTEITDQVSGFAAQLRALGANVIEFPVIATVPAADPGPLQTAIAKLETYDWLIFTSVNGVRYFIEALDASSKDLRHLKAKLCAIGPATKQALEAMHLKVDVMPEEYVAESLVQSFASIDLKGKRILLPRAAVARDVIPTELSTRGAIVEVVEVYRTVVPPESAALLEEAFSQKADWVTFTSSSTVKNFLAIAGPEKLQEVKIASIGPVTSDTARKHGLQVTVEAAEHTIGGLLYAMIG